MTLVCVTNQMNDMRSCTLRAEHLVGCNGWEYRYNEEHEREESTGRECRGCLPRIAQKGMLCWGCWDKVDKALVDWTPKAEFLLGHVGRAIQREPLGATSAPTGYVPIPSTRLAVDEVNSYFHSKTGDPIVWVSSTKGAMDALRFARAVTAALKANELEEKPHKVRRTRCASCGHLSLVWTPPHGSQDVEVTCSNPECRASLTQNDFEALVAGSDALVTAADQPVDRARESAELFDPTREDHAGLDPLNALTMQQLHVKAEELGLRHYKNLRKPDLVTALRDHISTETERKSA